MSTREDESPSRAERIEPAEDAVTPDAPPTGPTIRSVASAVILAAVCLAAIVVLPPIVAGGIVLAVSALYVFRRLLFSWTTMLILLAAVIMFIPIRRYEFPIPLSFALEPYRVIIAILIVAVIVAVSLSPTFAWRHVAFGWPIGIFLATQAFSIVANGPRLTEGHLDNSAMSNLLQLLFLISVFFIARQLLTSEQIVQLLLVFLTWAGVLVGFFAIIERFTRVNVFLLLGHFLPLTLINDTSAVSLRAGSNRSFASAQHPIALSVALGIIIPIALYLAAHGGRPRNPISRRIVYALGVAILLGGILCTVSRTGIVMLGIMFLVVLALRPRLAAVIFAFAFPIALIVAAVVPKLVNSTVGTLFNIDTLIASQFSNPGYRGQGRLADLGPALATFRQNPLFGTGIGSRVVVGPSSNSNILDNQWLGTLLDAGLLGVAGLVVFLLVPIIMLIVFAFRGQPGQKYASLAVAIAISTIGYGAAMFFYDAFSFMQTFLILMLLLAVGAWLLTEARRSAAAGARPTRLAADTVP
ncbi:MAG: O-antigen ligase family protein [Microbacteriaceae bacterium]